jgi:hypothetical protein
MVAVLSKYLIETATCAQVAHRFRPDCNRAALSIIFPSIRNSIKVYAFVFIVNNRSTKEPSLTSKLELKKLKLD